MSEDSVVPIERIHPRWSAKRWVVTITLLVVLVGGGQLLLGSRAVYHEWPWSSYPSTLHVCGRDFINEGSQTRSQILAGGEHLLRVGSVPGWLNHGELWTTTVGEPLDGSYCRVVMWVRIGGDNFESYALSGGP